MLPDQKLSGAAAVHIEVRSLRWKAEEETENTETDRTRGLSETLFNLCCVVWWSLQDTGNSLNFKDA